MNLNETIKGITLSKVCSIKACEGSTEKKNINLVVDFEGATLKGVFEKALAGAVITWQNGQGRKNFDSYKPGQTINIKFVSPATATVDPMDAIVSMAEAANMTVEEYVVAQLAKRNM